MHYNEPQAGEVIAIKRIGNKEWEMNLSCCDCGLVHKHHFELNGTRLEMKVYRDNRATGQIRRFRKLLAKNIKRTTLIVHRKEGR